MRVSRLASAAVLLVASASLGACSTYGQLGGVGVSVSYGDPYGSRYGYSPYGYSRYGYSPYSRYGYSRYGYSPYGYSPYGYSPYWGWNDGFYYPGTGFYVYDRYRRPYRWTDRQRSYWTDRQRSYTTRNRTSTDLRQNWEEFSRDSRAGTRVNRDLRTERRQERAEQRQQVRSERRQVWQQNRRERPERDKD